MTRVRKLWSQIKGWARDVGSDRRRRGEFDGWAQRFGCTKMGRIEAACVIARRLNGAEAALRQRMQETQREAVSPDMPGLTAAEIERLAVLAEECGEVVQAVCKVLRHGWKSSSPYGGKTNRAALEREIGDLRAIVGLMLDSRDLRLGDLQHWQRSKRAEFGRWTHHQACSLPAEEKQAMLRAAGCERGKREQ